MLQTMMKTSYFFQLKQKQKTINSNVFVCWLINVQSALTYAIVLADLLVTLSSSQR